MNRIFYFVLTILLSAQVANCQILDPVKWTFDSKDKGDGTYEIIFHAEMDGKWHVYSQDLGEDKIGPIPTTFTFEESPSYKRIGGVKEGTPVVEFDPNFEMDLAYFEHSADFKQTISSKATSPFHVIGNLEYMTCDDKQCIFPDPVEFDVLISPKAKPTEKKNTEEPSIEPSEVAVPVSSFPMATSEAVEEVSSGILEPVSWSYEAKAVEGSEAEYDLVFTASIDPHWHLYAMDFGEDKIGPVPTSFTFEDTGRKL